MKKISIYTNSRSTLGDTTADYGDDQKNIHL